MQSVAAVTLRVASQTGRHRIQADQEALSRRNLGCCQFTAIVNFHGTGIDDYERRRISGLPQEVLADRAFELIQQNNTCDNGGFAYWIDREGYHKVLLGD